MPYKNWENSFDTENVESCIFNFYCYLPMKNTAIHVYHLHYWWVIWFDVFVYFGIQRKEMWQIKGSILYYYLPTWI